MPKNRGRRRYPNGFRDDYVLYFQCCVPAEGYCKLNVVKGFWRIIGTMVDYMTAYYG